MIVGINGNILQKSALHIYIYDFVLNLIINYEWLLYYPHGTLIQKWFLKLKEVKEKFNNILTLCKVSEKKNYKCRRCMDI